MQRHALRAPGRRLRGRCRPRPRSGLLTPFRPSGRVRQLREAFGGDVAGDTQALAVRGADIVDAARQPRAAHAVAELHELASLLVAAQGVGALARRGAEQRVALGFHAMSSTRTVSSLAAPISLAAARNVSGSCFSSKRWNGLRRVAGTQDLRDGLTVRGERHVGVHDHAVAHAAARAAADRSRACTAVPAIRHGCAATSVAGARRARRRADASPRTSRRRPGARPSALIAHGSRCAGHDVVDRVLGERQRLGLPEHAGAAHLVGEESRSSPRRDRAVSPCRTAQTPRARLRKPRRSCRARRRCPAVPARSGS